VSPGDVIKAEQSVIELETDKATIEVPSSVGGKVIEVKVKAGDKVKVGQVVLTLEAAAAGEEKPAAKAEAPPVAPKPDAASPKPAAKTDEVAPKPTAKADVTAEVASPKRDAGDHGKVVDITSARPSTPRMEPGRPAAAAASTSLELAPSVAAAPSVRRFARELGVEIGDVPGTGPGGRIGQDDVKDHVKAVLSAGPSTPSGAGPSTTLGAGARATLPDFTKWGEIDAKPMSNIRRKTAEHLSQAWAAIPHVTQHDKADITALEAFRKSYAARADKAVPKLTVTAFLVKIVVLAIDRFPQFASSADMANERIIYKRYRHIGVATDTPNGLLVPVVRDADRKTVVDIAAELSVLSQKARDKKISLDEMAGGVFSISNLGGIGGTAFTPIVNLPEVAILGVSRGVIEPVWRGGQFVPREMLPLSLSYDHRVIDGADAVRFLRVIVEMLEQPLTMYI
jgi:pyruvate dehydrogenase E2 component (dihydrolipoamide acetyltransferase)